MNIKKVCVVVMIFLSMSAKAADQQQAHKASWEILASKFSEKFYQSGGLNSLKRAHSAVNHLMYRMNLQDDTNALLQYQSKCNAQEIKKLRESVDKQDQINDWYDARRNELEQRTSSLRDELDASKKKEKVLELVMGGLYKDFSILKQQMALLTETFVKQSQPEVEQVATLNDIRKSRYLTIPDLISLCESLENSNRLFEEKMKEQEREIAGLWHVILKLQPQSQNISQSDSSNYHSPVDCGSPGSTGGNVGSPLLDFPFPASGAATVAQAIPGLPTKKPKTTTNVPKFDPKAWDEMLKEEEEEFDSSSGEDLAILSPHSDLSDVMGEFSGGNFYDENKPDSGYNSEPEAKTYPKKDMSTRKKRSFHSKRDSFKRKKKRREEEALQPQNITIISSVLLVGPAEKTKKKQSSSLIGSGVPKHKPINFEDLWESDDSKK